jgi:hypothetical protein
MKIHTRLLALLLLTTLLMGLATQPMLAADDPNPAPAVACRGDDCTLTIDLDGWQVPLLWRYGAPLLVDSLQAQGRLPAGTTLAIDDDLTLALPLGDLQLLDANLRVTLNDQQTVESFRGTARVPFPAIGPFENLAGADPLHADVGFDYGANLTAIAAPLDPEARYFFIDFGSGVRLDGAVKDAAGAVQSVSLATPHGQRAVLVIDPLRPLVYLQGQLTLSHIGGLAFIDTALAANGIDAPAFDFASLPGRTSVGVEALLTDDPALAYLELNTGSAIDGGALAHWAGVDVTPIAIDGVAHIDHTGLRVTGATRSALLPATVWESRGQVEVFVPFAGGLGAAYVDAGGAIAVPVAQINAEGTSRLALPATPSVLAATPAAEERKAPGLWARTTAAAGAGLTAAGDAVAWTGDVVGAGAGVAWNAAGAGLTAAGDAVAWTGGVVGAGAGAAWNATASGATAAWQGTTCGLPLVRNVLCAAQGEQAVASNVGR